MRSTSIKRRLMLVGLSTGGVALLSASILLGGHAWIQARQQLLDRLEVTARIVGSNCTAALTFDDHTAATETLSALRGAPGVVRAVLYDKRGRTFAEYQADPSGKPGPAPQARPVTRSIRAGQATVFSPVVLDGETIGTLYVEAGTQGVDARLARQAGVMALIVMASLLLAQTLLRRQRDSIARPVLDLAGLMKHVVETRDYSARAPASRDDELGVLASGFNEMLHDIQQRDQRLEDHRRSLEEEVARRTAELASANHRLKAELAERQRAEKALERAAQEWQTTFDAIGDAVGLLDAQHRLVRGNRALTNLLGAHLEDLVGKPLDALLVPVLGHAPPTLDTGGSRRQTRTIGAGGRWFEHRRDPIRSESGEVTGYVQLVSDISEQRSLQEQLSHAQKMEAIGRLAGGVAHDFNNLLSVIIAFSGFLVQDLPAGSELRSSALEIKRAGDRAASLTRQLLAFGRKRVLVPEILKVDEIVANLSRMIARLIGEDIELSLRVGNAVGCVHMDRAELEQVLMNLAVNARDAMPQGGKLAIAVRNLDVTADRPPEHARLPAGRYVQIQVSDTGTGMSPETIERIFEPFFTTKPQGKGTGLGLAIVYGVMEQSGGHIEVTSELGRGTAFTLHLPRVQLDLARASVAPVAPPRGKGELVLLVEDDAQVRVAIRRMLEGNGYRVLEANDGEHGIAQFSRSQEAVSLVLTDLVMPGMGGFAMGKHLRARRTDLPILYMTGYSEEMLSGQGLPGQDEVLNKPFEMELLLRRIRNVLERNQ